MRVKQASGDGVYCQHSFVQQYPCTGLAHTYNLFTWIKNDISIYLLLLRSGPCILIFYVSGKMKQWKNRTESAKELTVLSLNKNQTLIFQSGGRIIAFFSVHIEGVWDEIGRMVCFTMHENGIRWKLRTHSSGGNVWTAVKYRNENYYFPGLAICIPLAFFEAIEPVLLFHFPLLQNEWNVLLSNKSTLRIKFSPGTLAVRVLLVMNSWQRHRCSWPNTRQAVFRRPNYRLPKPTGSAPAKSFAFLKETH